MDLILNILHAMLFFYFLYNTYKKLFFIRVLIIIVLMSKNIDKKIYFFICRSPKRQYLIKIYFSCIEKYSYFYKKILEKIYIIIDHYSVGIKKYYFLSPTQLHRNDYTISIVMPTIKMSNHRRFHVIFVIDFNLNYFHK